LLSRRPCGVCAAQWLRSAKSPRGKWECSCVPLGESIKQSTENHRRNYCGRDLCAQTSAALILSRARSCWIGWLEHLAKG